MHSEPQPSVCYRHPSGTWPDVWPSDEDYAEAIAALQDARTQLRPDGGNCSVCGDSGHQAFECHHNPLLLARKWTKTSGVWRCWHCGFTATNETEARAHFGANDEEPAACQTRPASAPFETPATPARAKTAEAVRAELLAYFRQAAQVWATLPNKTALERCDGLAFSLLGLFDGVAPEMPAMDIVLAPHPDDKQYRVNKGVDWYEPGMVVNADVHLHDEYYREQPAAGAQQ